MTEISRRSFLSVAAGAAAAVPFAATATLSVCQITPAEFIAKMEGHDWRLVAIPDSRRYVLAYFQRDPMTREDRAAFDDLTADLILSHDDPFPEVASRLYDQGKIGPLPGVPYLLGL